MKKQVIFLFFIFLNKFYFAQSTKVYNGPFKNTFTYGNDGNAIYNYYEDESTREYIKHGEFKYTFNGTTDKLKGFTQVITGNFNKGLRNGQWVYNYTMKDVGPDENGYYTTLNLSLTSNYKDGYASGTWKEKGIYKKRNTYYSNGQNLWNEYTKDVNVEIIMNFLNGKSCGDFYINDGEALYKAKGKFDNLSLGSDIWEIIDVNTGEDVKITFKDNFIIDIISRNSSGVVNTNSLNNQKLYDEFIIAKNLPINEREEQGLFIDTIPSNDDVSVIRKLLKKYIDKIFDGGLFMYNEIGGDLSYNEKDKILGGEVRLTKVKYDLLTDNKFYSEGQKNIEKNQYLKAYENFNEIKIFLKPSEKKILQLKIDFVNQKVDSTLKSLENNKIYIKNLINKSNDTINRLNSICLNSVFNEGKNKIKEIYSIIDKENDEIKKTEKTEKLILCKDHNEFLKKYLKNKQTKYNLKIEDINIDIFNSSSQFYYKNNQISVYDNKNEEIIKDLINCENDFKNAIVFINNNANIQNKITEIEKLNDEHNKKTIYKKNQIVLSHYKYQISDFLQREKHPSFYDTEKTKEEEYSKMLVIVHQMNIFLDNIIYLYSDKFKAIEKELKDIENPEEIKNYVMKIK